ncbi:alpha/beta hydrolase [Acidithiobacillus thiooxidans]|uniref:alpha/beta fold hydrolase n=1 Tax=Acidithiobacillus thiooxidans TaxID=930 RepID=UPI002854709E|nr:alpha/beta hydrolase [Acidithiobacillus thiooxidans]MDR7926071.1 alpha/beta hydrolase [Acidithiobacillus thiooxidans]
MFFFHGTPGSRFQLDLLPAALLENVHWIAIDRPGYGESSRCPGLSMADVTATVSDCANHLAIDRFQVLGFSGGGPYALACAQTMRDRVTAVHIVSSLGPVDIPEVWSALRRQDHLLFTLARRSPRLFSLLLRLSMWGVRQNPERFIAQLAEKMSAQDQALLIAPDTHAVLNHDLQEALQQDTIGMADDLRVLSRPWPFQLEDIRVPVHLWQGPRIKSSTLISARPLRPVFPKLSTITWKMALI